MTNKPSDYWAIAAWGRMMRSFPYYIQGQQDKAAKDAAPLDAIYCDASTGKWHLASEIVNEATRGMIERSRPKA